MSMRSNAAPFRPVALGPVEVEKKQYRDGVIELVSRRPLEPYPACLGERLVHWAETAPERIFVGRRGADGRWITLTYAETLERVRAIGQALLARDLGTDRTVVILSENSIEHLLLALAAMHVSIPYAPISPAYSLVSEDFGKLRHVLELMTPGLIFVQDGARYARALNAVAGPGTEVVAVDNLPDHRPVTPFGDLLATAPGPDVEAAFAATGPDTVAKVLFTSGSTGMPKGVINTQRMLCANLQQILQSFPVFGERPPVLIDWLPWNHTFGGNHNVGIALYNGGSFYIDDGRPTPAGIQVTLANLREIPPTVYFNVPKGFEELIPHLERDPMLRETFFDRLKLLFYAGAGMSQHVWDSLDRLAVAARGRRVVITSGLGCTESAPSALFAHWPESWSGLLGVPVPGLSLRLAPVGDKLEARYRGPNVTPGYWRQPELTERAFDEAGYYCTGDALRFHDPADSGAGLVFDGRIAEDFKLATGTWVSVDTLRAAIVQAFAPLVQDAVLAGHDGAYLAAVLFPNLTACREYVGLAPDVPDAEVVAHPRIREHIRGCLDELAGQATGSANRVERAVLTEAPPSIDAGEVTDKGSLNQRNVLAHRAALVAELYAEPPGERIFRIRRSAAG